MLSERTIINGLIILGGLILGPYLIAMTFEVNQLALLSFAALVFLFIIFFFFGDRLCAFPYLGSRFPGKLNFLPFGLMPVEIASLTLILYCVVNYILLKRRPLDFGPRYFLVPFLVLGGILIYHNHKIGLQALGSGDMGGRRGLFTLIAILTYFCGINIPSPSVSFFRWLPFYGFLATFGASLPMILTTYFPSLSPFLYYASSNVNIEAYTVSQGGNVSDMMERNGAILAIAGPLQGLLIIYFPMSTWWRPSRWPIFILWALCIYGVLVGGFRSAFLSVIISTVLVTIGYVRWRVLFFAPLLIIVPLIILIIQDNHPWNIKLPRTVQRTMSFIPANWDSDAVASAQTSNAFRSDITHIYMKEYFYKSPWIGNGFAFNGAEAEGLETMSHTPGVSDPDYFETKSFIVSKLFHVGWISLYDAVGIIGGIAFIFLNMAVIIVAAWHVFHKGSDRASPTFPLKVGTFAGTATGFFGYFATFGDFNQAAVGLCNIAIILVHLTLLERKTTHQIVSASPQKQLNLSKQMGQPYAPAPSV